MGSFKDKLEILDIRPRFVDPTSIAHVRRDSNAHRLHQESNIIFLNKRDRLESEDFVFIPQPTPQKQLKDYDYHLMNSCEKFDKWNVNLMTRQDIDINPLDIAEVSFHPQPSLLEAESVIDQKLTIDLPKFEAAAIVNEKMEAATQEAEPVKEEPKFVFKVKKTDTKFIISNNAHDDSIGDDMGSEIIDQDPEFPEDKPNNLMFADEATRLSAKITRAMQYWNKTSLLIPNVFRLLRMFDDDKDNVLEFQDYSRKELLVQTNGLKFKPSKDKGMGIKKIKQKSD